MKAYITDNNGSYTVTICGYNSALEVVVDDRETAFELLIKVAQAEGVLGE